MTSSPPTTARWALTVLAVTLASTASAANGPPRVVPWLDQRPAQAPLRPLAPPCRAGNLKARLSLQGATGSYAGVAILTNVDRHPCSLLGRPKALFAGGAAARTRWRVTQSKLEANPWDEKPPRGYLRGLRRGQSAGVWMVWSNWCGPGSVPTGDPGARPRAIVLRLPAGTRVKLPVDVAPRCDSPSGPSTLSVDRFRPRLPQPSPRSKLPLRAAIVAVKDAHVKGARAIGVRPGSVLRYRVALTNTSTRDFRFRSCPRYTQSLSPWPPPQTFVLNCRPAATLGPKQTVLFAMEFRVPGSAHGPAEIYWDLAPHTYEPPSAFATVLVQ